MNAAITRTHVRCANGFGTGTGPRLGARAGCFGFVLPLPLIAIYAAFGVRFRKRPMMIAAS